MKYFLIGAWVALAFVAHAVDDARDRLEALEHQQCSLQEHRE